MLTIEDKTKIFIALTLSPNKLTDEEVSALWTIAKYANSKEKLLFNIDPSAAGSLPVVWRNPRCVPRVITIRRHVIGILERRGVLKRRHTNEFFKSINTLFYTWDIIWKKTKAFPQLKELRIQKALGSI